MTFDATTPVGDIALAHPGYGRVLQRHRIDYCCGGHAPLGEACAQAGVDLATVLAELASVGGEVGSRDFRAMSTPALVGHIIVRHHAYLRDALPAILEMSAKVARVHGEKDGRLVAVDDAARRLERLIQPHLDWEEQTLFPAMMRAGPAGAAPTLHADLETMRADHREVGHLLGRIRELTDGYVPPSWACTTYRMLLRNLEELERDLYEHVHLENHVLARRFTT